MAARRVHAGSRLPVASAADLVAVAYSAAAWLATGALPQSSLPGLAALLATLTRWARPALVRSASRELCQRLGGLDSEAGERLFREHLRRRHEHVLGRIRDTHRRGWRPAAELVGAEHLRSALDRGHGAVLWGMSFCGPVVPKMALARAGFRVVQLSRPDHGGFSTSWVAIHLLNRLAVCSERRHLAGRVVLPPGGSLASVRRLRGLLESNACVSLSGEHRGRRNVTVRYLGIERELATGAPSLARSTGASLLTLHSYRLAANAYRVVLDEPIRLAGTRSARGVEEACRRFGARLEREIRAHPADWEGWSLRASR